MYKRLLLLGFLFLSVSSFPQDDAEKTDAEKKADSILNEFFKNRDINPESEPGIDSAKLEEAESRYMDNFLQVDRNPRKELVHKRILQIAIGLCLLAILIMGFRKKRRLIRRDNRPPRI